MYSHSFEQRPRVGRFLVRTGSQAMVDNQGDDLPAPRHRPVTHEQGQGQRVPSSRHRHGDDRLGLERLERRHEAGERFAIQRPDVFGGQLHPFFWRSWSIRRFWRSVARG